MTPAEAIELAQRVLLLTLYTALPPLAAAFLAALGMGYIQARISSDTTISAVPKILAAGAALLIFGAWMATLMSDFWIELWQALPQIIR